MRAAPFSTVYTAVWVQGHFSIISVKNKVYFILSLLEPKLVVGVWPLLCAASPSTLEVV